VLSFPSCVSGVKGERKRKKKNKKKLHKTDAAKGLEGTKKTHFCSNPSYRAIRKKSEKEGDRKRWRLGQAKKIKQKKKKRREVSRAKCPLSPGRAGGKGGEGKATCYS